MAFALQAGAVMFAVGALVQLVALAWLAIGVAITGVAGSILVRTGGLEPRTFGTCVTAAVVVDAVLLLAIIMAAIVKRLDQEAPGEEGPYLRRPVMMTAAGLLIALLAVTAGGWRRSPYFPYPLATVVVLANAYFFALISVLYIGRVIDKIWVPLKAWARSSPYRAGFLTATLLLAGIAGMVVRESGWTRETALRLVPAAELRRAPAVTGFVDAQLTGLCVAAGELAPELARGPSAPGCRFLGDAESSAMGLIGSGPDCFTTLEPDLRRAKGILRAELRIGAYDADDIAMDALVKTCLREPLPDDVRAYFFAIVRNMGRKAAGAERRTMVCSDVDERAPPPTCSIASPELREYVLELAWQYTFCTLDDRTAGVLRNRFVDGLSFRAIGERWEIPEDEARYVFHNAIKKLRRLLGDCLR